MLLDELLLGIVAGADLAHHLGRVGADAGGEVVEEALGRGQVLGAAGVDHDAEVLQARDASAHLVERTDALRLAREELLEVALEVTVQPDRAHRRRHGENEGERPQQPPVAKGPCDERACPRAGPFAASHAGRRA